MKVRLLESQKEKEGKKNQIEEGGEEEESSSGTMPLMKSLCVCVCVCATHVSVCVRVCCGSTAPSSYVGPLRWVSIIVSAGKSAGTRAALLQITNRRIFSTFPFLMIKNA